MLVSTNNLFFELVDSYTVFKINNHISMASCHKTRTSDFKAFTISS